MLRQKPICKNNQCGAVRSKSHKLYSNLFVLFV